MPKSILKSRTFWVNALTLVAGVSGYLIGQDLIQDNAQLVAILAAVQGAVNIALRLVTDEPVRLSID